ncbi:cytochrome b5 [Amylocystis lapponica]|nr:cytochrome b5 [Amylocystis lapponica]
MSWIMHLEGDGKARTKRLVQRPSADGADDASAGTQAPGAAPAVAEAVGDDEEPMVQDPADPHRLVSAKRANRPFLGYADYRKEQEKEHQAWERRMAARAAKMARGEDGGPAEPDPTEEPEVGCVGLLRFLLYCAVFALLAGKFVTGSFVWDAQLPSLRQFLPTNQRLFSESMLATYDGSSTDKPLYLAIDGDVYDVSANRGMYGPGGSYHMMAGRDAARAYGTGCFTTHLTHDLRGLSEQETQGVQHWKNFYAAHKKYVKVGRVSHPPIDPGSPVPEHCDPAKAKAPYPGMQQQQQSGREGPRDRQEL